MKKRILAMLLLVAMIVTALPLMVLPTLAAEEEKAKSDSALVRTIKSFIEKYLRYEDEEPISAEEKIKNMLDGIADKIKAKFKPKR